MAWNKTIKKTIFLLNINYSPEITKLTYPLIRKYADKIGAGIHVITARKFPDWPITYEKLQIYQLAQEMENDWNIYIDSDTLIHHDTPDFTGNLSRDTILHNGIDFSPLRFRPDRFFLRDNRNIGSCNWLTIASDWCIELWKPLDDLTPQAAIANIFPISDELKTTVNAEHLIDDYALSRNIAQYGLKAWTMDTFWEKMGGKAGEFFWHQYQISEEEKIKAMQNILLRWGKTQAQVEKEKGAWLIPKHA